MCFALFTFVVDYKAYYCRTEDNGTGLIVMWSHHRLWVASLFVILLYLIDVFKKNTFILLILQQIILLTNTC